MVSAMAGKTNELVAWAREAAPLHDAREYDAVVASGEQVTAGLLAIALQEMGINARSWQGWQIPIRTDGSHGAARIQDIDGERLIERFEQGQVAVVAGFQGIGPDNRIATLGRGGSDTSAVAIAAAVKADRCDIYTDVDGVYTTDPRIVPKARRLAKVSFEEMLEMASLGAKVLQVRSVELAMVHRVRDLRALVLRRRRCAGSAAATTRPERSFATRKRSWNSRSSPASPTPRTRRRSRSAASPTSRASPPASSGRWPKPTSTST